MNPPTPGTIGIKIKMLTKLGSESFLEHVLARLPQQILQIVLTGTLRARGTWCGP
jgi:hypothetical protein